MELSLCPRNHPREMLAADGSLLCGPCFTQVKNNLRELPGLHDALLRDLMSPPRRINPTKVSGGRVRDHLNVAAFDIRHEILTILDSWSGIIVGKLGAPAPARSVLDLTRFLLRHLEWLTAQPTAADFTDEIDRLHTEAQSVANPAHEDTEAYALKCVVAGCSGTIDASPRRAAGNGSTLTCSSGHSWDVSEWLTLRQLAVDDERNST